LHRVALAEQWTTQNLSEPLRCLVSVLHEKCDILAGTGLSNVMVVVLIRARMRSGVPAGLRPAEKRIGALGDPIDAVKGDIHCCCQLNARLHSDLHSGFCYPGHTAMRLFPQYHIGIRGYDSRYAEGAGTCEKGYNVHPTLLPGIFAIFCPHDVCLGYDIVCLP